MQYFNHKMKKLGELLRETRERKKLSIEDISNSTKIRSSMVVAIENGDYRNFNNDVHIQSFIKTYASFLGIDKEKAIALYRRERQILDEGVDVIKNKLRLDYSLFGKIQRLLTIKTVISISLFFITSVIIYFFYIQFQAFYVPPRLAITSPSQNAIVENETFVIEGITDNISVKVYVDGTEASFIDSDGRFRVVARFNQPGPKRFTITAENQFGKNTQYNLDLIYSPIPEQSVNHKLNIVNIHTEEIEFSYRIDERLLFENLIIRPFEQTEIVFDSRIEVRGIDVNKLNLFLNNNQNPLKSIESENFTIIFESGVPIIKTN
jgi:transcriptional regulator with XRE-family HTH domain